MKKRMMFLLSAALTALLFGGCAMRTVEEMYALPKRSDAYNEMQSAIDTAMYGMTYASPLSGENQQTVQMADLDGDGEDEILVFAKGATEKPLQVLIFTKDANGRIRTMETIGSNGLAFEQVEYVDFDDKPGCELIVGIRVGDQVQRSVAVYTFKNGDAELMLLNGYSKFLTCDLDENGCSELMVLRPGEQESEGGMAVLYHYANGQIERSVEMALSENPGSIRRIMQGKLENNKPAVFIASTVDQNAIITDVLTLRNNELVNIAVSNDVNTSVHTLRNYFVYAEDIDNDGVIEIPSIITMKPVSYWTNEEEKHFLRWYSFDENGWEHDKLFTFHNFLGGWYLQLGNNWASRVTVEQYNSVYKFYLWDETYQAATPLFTLYVFTGGTRDEEAVKNGRFAVYRAEGVAYSASLESAAAEYGITEDYIIESFRLIRNDWQTGET
ncbi:MAG: hypothetical protein U0N82_13395 [Oscillospiraceae bacterium]